MNTDALLTYSDLTQRYNRTYKTIWLWVKQGQFPQPIRVSNKTVGWRKEDIEAFEQQADIKKPAN